LGGDGVIPGKVLAARGRCAPVAGRTSRGRDGGQGADKGLPKTRGTLFPPLNNVTFRRSAGGDVRVQPAGPPPCLNSGLRMREGYPVPRALPYLGPGGGSPPGLVSRISQKFIVGNGSSFVWGKLRRPAGGHRAAG